MPTKYEIKVLDLIKKIMDENSYGLKVEIFYFAFKYLKDNPKVSIEEALNYGYNEWIK